MKKKQHISHEQDPANVFTLWLTFDLDFNRMANTSDFVAGHADIVTRVSSDTLRRRKVLPKLSILTFLDGSSAPFLIQLILGDGLEK